MQKETGRSMIEMLGVLAIIGVLSVGGIAGYSKAMMKFKINKLIEQANTVINNIRITFANELNYNQQQTVYDFYDYFDDIAPIILPDEMMKSIDSDGRSCEYGDCDYSHVFGGEFAPGNCIGDHAQYDFSFSGLPKEACIALATSDFGKDRIAAIGVGTIRSEGCNGWGDEEEVGFYEDEGWRYIVYTSGSYYPMSIAKATQYCSICTEEINDGDMRCPTVTITMY